jgi:pimeloyl-ACP methyl ester carboxylesterase
MKRFLILGSLAFGALVFAGSFGAGCGLQRSALFPRPVAPAGAPSPPQGTEVVWLGTDANVEAWFMRPVATASAFPVVIFAHGNAELIDHWAPAFRQVSASGIGTLLVEYPGYGRSGGTPSQGSITQIMLAAHDFLTRQVGVDPEAIVAYGRSLGGAAACALATERRLSALVLESTFTSIRAMAAQMGFPGSLVVDPFDNLRAVRSLDIPILVLHGERDTLIPVSHGELLAAAAGTQLVRMPCGHNDCPWAWRSVEAFLVQQGLHHAP